MTKNETIQWQLPGDRRCFYIPKEGESLTWVQSVEPPIELNEEELKRVATLKLDAVKVLCVKRLLELNKTPSEIHKDTGVARNSVYKYMRTVYTRKYTKSRSKDSQSTLKQDCVLSILLLVSQLYGQSTGVIVLLLFIAGGVLYWTVIEWQSRYVQQMKEAHREEMSDLSNLFHRAVNLSFRREAIVCETKQERIYYDKACKHYKNGGRKLITIIRKDSENNHNYYYRKREAARKYDYANADLIKDGIEDAGKYWGQLEEEGLLDCFRWPHGAHYEKSLAYVQKTTQWLSDHPRPTHRTAKEQNNYLIEQLNTVEWNLNQPESE